jgi:ABC-type glycerol-3-phosphate transport system permease component
MACGLIATLPLIIAFLFFQRSFISGITAGAVKT